MAMTPEERREKERLRKAAARAKNRATPHLTIVGAANAKPSANVADRGTDRGTDDGTDDPNRIVPFSNVTEATRALAAMEIPDSARWRAALVMTLAQDLDGPLAVAQRSSLSQRYSEAMLDLAKVAAPRERDKLDEMRRNFYTGGGGDGGDTDKPTAEGTSRRRKQA